MREITRKELLKGGVVGAASVAALPFARSVAFASNDDKGVVVHVHGTVRLTEAFGDLPKGFPFDISVDAAGQKSELSGAGWDNDKFDSPSATQSFACYYSQRGKLESDTIQLGGVVFLSNTTGFLGASVKTVASLETNDITWTFGPGPSFPATVVLTGKGVVTKID